MVMPCPYCRGAGSLAAAEPPAPSRLTKTTARLFNALRSRLGQTVTYPELTAEIWGQHPPVDPNMCIRALVKRLRCRMAGLAWRIEANAGLGYTMIIGEENG